MTLAPSVDEHLAQLWKSNRNGMSKDFGGPVSTCVNTRQSNSLLSYFALFTGSFCPRCLLSVVRAV